MKVVHYQHPHLLPNHRSSVPSLQLVQLAVQVVRFHLVHQVMKVRVQVIVVHNHLVPVTTTAPVHQVQNSLLWRNLLVQLRPVVKFQALVLLMNQPQRDKIHFKQRDDIVQITNFQVHSFNQ